MRVEQSAGCVLIDCSGAEPRALVIRVRKYGFELPKGHVEPGETPEQSALRELREETGLESEVEIGPEVGSIEYTFPSIDGWVGKRVRFFAAHTRSLPVLGPLPDRTRELRWVPADDIEMIQLVSENLRPIISVALSRYSSAGPAGLEDL